MHQQKSSAGPRVALVGLGFGAEFVPIYRDHPDVSAVAVCDADPSVLNEVGDRFGIQQRYRSLEEVLADDAVDAVHLVTALPEHGRQSIAALGAGKHCASTVPMALDVDELHEIVRLEAESGRNYMMMETAVYTREFLHCQQLLRDGRFGAVTFGKGLHYQDMSLWPDYWDGLPPLWYMTHAISPLLRLLGTRATSVCSLGSGRLPSLQQQRYANPYPAETAIFELDGSDVAVEVSRTLFRAARSYTEAFSLYGENYGFEWPQVEDEPPLHYSFEGGGTDRSRQVAAHRVPAPDRADLLPTEIAGYTQQSVHGDGSHASFVQGGGHGGSHPHLVHEFVRSIVEGRPAAVDAVTAADWTAPGLVAHESALRHGERLQIPSFALEAAPAEPAVATR